MQLLLHTPGVSADEAVRLNRLRRQSDRWSDVFVGHLSARHDVAHFAANPPRARDYAADFRERPQWQPGESAWRLLGRAWRARPGVNGVRRTALDDRGEEVAAAMLECFEPEELVAAGLSQSLWLMRFQSVACQTHEMLQQLCEQEFA